MIRIYLIGCGGIGGYLARMLPEVCAGAGLMYIQNLGINVTRYLETIGQCEIPSIVDSITMIDGDRFEPRNALRQGAGAGNKLAQRVCDINNNMIRLTTLRNMSVIGFNKYVTPMNIDKLIPVERPDRMFMSANKQKFEQEICKVKGSARADMERDSVVIFMGVDNLSTRRDICLHAEKFPNILLINGGNETTFGDVTVYERRHGEALDPNLTEIFPNVKNPTDKRPDEVHCTDLAPTLDQTVIINMMIATTMLAIFDHWVVKGTLDDFETKTANKTGRKNHIFVNSLQCSMYSMLHKLPKKENTNNASSP